MSQQTAFLTKVPEIKCQYSIYVYFELQHCVISHQQQKLQCHHHGHLLCHHLLLPSPPAASPTLSSVAFSCASISLSMSSPIAISSCHLTPVLLSSAYISLHHFLLPAAAMATIPPDVSMHRLVPLPHCMHITQPIFANLSRLLH